MMTRKKNKEIIFIALLAFAILLGYFILPGAIALEPNGADITAGNPETAPNDTAGFHNASAGNISYLGIKGFSTTLTWQGYFGNVSGVIQLADDNDYVMYNWTLADPEGEVYATRNHTILWTMVQCLNYTANGSYLTGGEVGGATNLAGMNLSTLETMYNLSYDDVDGVNETFISKNHNTFYTAQKEFIADECYSAHPYTTNGYSEDSQFEEVLLYEPTTVSVIFASILEETSVMGFNKEDNDFEMMVLEDGHGTNIDPTLYYFFVELE